MQGYSSNKRNTNAYIDPQQNFKINNILSDLQPVPNYQGSEQFMMGGQPMMGRPPMKIMPEPKYMPPTQQPRCQLTNQTLMLNKIQLTQRCNKDLVASGNTSSTHLI
jgi:hypothetical protein